MGTHRNEQAAPSAHDVADEILEEIKQQLALIQFGSLEIQVHNGQVVQIERREKKRWKKVSTPNNARLFIVILSIVIFYCITH